jgi:hypothetical protein
MFCETPDEITLYDLLRSNFQTAHDYTLDLMAWVYINKPDRFYQIIEAHKQTDNNQLVELESIDIKKLLQNKN